MSAGAEVLQTSGAIRPSPRESALPKVESIGATSHWNPDDFAREQIRGLVRRVFFGSGTPPVRQIVLSAAEPHIDVGWICEQVARALAQETQADIGLVDRDPKAGEVLHTWIHSERSVAIKSGAIRMAANLWRVPGNELREAGQKSGTGLHWLSRLEQLRNEFEYVVIHGPTAGLSSEAAMLGQLTDGIILVLGAHSTRKATALKIKEALEAAQSRILGTVLSARTFPIPERIYRCL
jgi:protein-tyrosine kinase